jgi:hypothetical protein
MSRPNLAAPKKIEDDDEDEDEYGEEGIPPKWIRKHRPPCEATPGSELPIGPRSFIALG